MALRKQEIPILEYDDNPIAVLEPTHEKLGFSFPKKCVFAFLEEIVWEYAEKHHCPVIGEFVTITKSFLVWKVLHKGEEIALVQAPLGSAAAGQFLDWLIGYGVREVIAAGSCGVLVDLPENHFLIPTKALRDEGTSYHYLPAERYVSIQEAYSSAIAKTLDRHHLPYTFCSTWTTDGFFRETEEMVAYRREEGCAVVEMECAALASVAQFRKVGFGQLLYTADSLANAQQYKERGWGEDSREIALQLCLDSICNI